MTTGSRHRTNVTMPLVRRVHSRPYDDQPELAQLSEPPPPEERMQYTFCGT